ncbi:response regulator [Colwellia demingiae]|uniref:Response regulator n=1 Tax=Colwellia demingiae TaxID=89401 RepID=A0A5C6QIU6_9GAMM|nr:response regulator [Colwellia demingiae]TWX68801.1 response regulator [Colwellia demingiae]
MPSNFSDINALVIDNNSSMRQIMVSMLRVMGMKTVIVANSESQCMQLIAADKINLVVCGWNLPKLNALSVLKKLRDNENTMKTPFVIVSTMIEQDLIKQAIAHGVSEYLVPPFNKKIFENRINKALKMPIQASATSLSRTINSKRFSQKVHCGELDVLVVDDIADNIAIIKELIKDKYRVKAALNAKTAMKICLSDSPPDLILLDIMMPEVDGLTLCKQLKENPLTQNIVVIFLTALSETEDVVKGLSLGAVDYITKPIVPAILLARIEVHSKIILNQRTIQGQIDNLLQQNEMFTQSNDNIYNKLNKLLRDSTETLIELSTTVNTKSSKRSLSQLEYNIGMSTLLLDSGHVLAKLQQSNYTLTITKEKLRKLLFPILSIFDFAIANKNIEAFDNIDENINVNCDKKLLIIIFACLYLNALDAAPRGSKVSITSEVYQDFILIKIHNITEISEEGLDNIAHLSLSNKTNKINDMSINLAFLAMNKLQGELYFHSHKEFGTTFYLKLPC